MRRYWYACEAGMQCGVGIQTMKDAHAAAGIIPQGEYDYGGKENIFEMVCQSTGESNEK